MPSFTSSGTISVFGCARVEKEIYVLYRWGERSVVYVKPKAIKGILEKIAVKKVIMNLKFGQYKPIYMDTMNSLYNEDELISETEARTLAQDYLDLQKEKIAENLRRCGSNTI